MRIAQIAPLAEAVPPRAYGGTERVVHWLTEALVRMGHEVTLFASGDSQTSAELVPCCPTALRAADVRDHAAHLLVMLDRVRERSADFDLLHFHIDLLQFPIFRNLAGRTLTTLHGRLDMPEIRPIFERFPHMPLVSISDAQRQPMPPVNWMATVHHGLPLELIGFSPNPEGYLAFLGRIAPEKRVDRAIDIAVRAGVPLRIAAKVDPADQHYFEEHIRPKLGHPLVEFVGEIDDATKGRFLGGARALLFPIDWPEPFGLVMVESMAAGAPVIAWPNGAAPEVVEDGVTGRLVRSVDEAVRAVEEVSRMDRAIVRRRFEDRFTVQRMAGDYVAVYDRLLTRGRPARRSANLPAAVLNRRSSGGVSLRYPPATGRSGAMPKQSKTQRKTVERLRATKRRERTGETARQRDERDRKTRAELYAEAKRRELPGRSKMDKAELERALRR